MHRTRKFLGLLATVVFAGCTTTAIERGPSRPAIVPTGWVADYDYESGIQRYLRLQYDSARVEGATAYVYIYNDSSTSCRNVRRLVEREKISPILRDARISMLSFYRLKSLYPHTRGVAFDPGNAAGVFVKITMDGALSDAMFHAALFLCCPEYMYQFGYSDPREPTLEEFVEELQRYFVRNTEI